MKRADLAAARERLAGHDQPGLPRVHRARDSAERPGIVCLMALGILSSFDLADHPLDSQTACISRSRR